jgi:hypothetical protein
MKTHNLIAGAAAILFTTASLSFVNYNVAAVANSSPTQTIEVVDLAPVNVYATPEDRRAATLMTDPGTASFASAPATSLINEGSSAAQFSLIGSQLVMPYYSFGNKFGRITKE